MTNPAYIVPPGGMPEQSGLITDRAVFTDAYAVIPGGVMRDIVTSKFPFWEKTRAWVLARPQFAPYPHDGSHFLPGIRAR